MAWSSGFINALNSGAITPKYELKFLNTGYFQGSSISIVGGFQSSQKLQIYETGPRINGCSVIPGTWNVTFGSFSVPVVGDITSIYPEVKKGSLAELYCYFGSVKERIAIGQLRNIYGFGERWTLDFVDLLTAMTSRLSGVIGTPGTGLPDQFEWFYQTRMKGLTTGNWNTTGSAPFPTAIAVDDIRGFLNHQRKFPASLELGLARCIPANTSDEFFVTYNSAVQTSGNNGQLNITSPPTLTSNIYPSQRTTQNMPVGSEVYPAALLKDEPYRIFARLITSIDGDNLSSWDHYPKSWNFGGTLNDSIFDYGDAKNHHEEYIESSLQYKWDYVITDPWSGGIRQFITSASNTGQWPVWRQNSITWRGAHNFNLSQNIAAQITDNEIISINRIDLYNPNQRSLYQSTTITYLTTGAGSLGVQEYTSNDMTSLPLLATRTIDNSFIYGYDPHTEQVSRSRIADADVERLYVFDGANTTKVSLTLPLKYAHLCAGDIIFIRSKYISLRKPYTKNLGDRAMVTAHSFSIGEQRVNIDIIYLQSIF
jgi:hypothetical protein